MRRVRIEAALSLLLAREGAPPPERGVEIVGSRVDERLLLVVLEPVRIARASGEAELEDVHSREAEGASQLLDCRCDHAQVLGDERQVAQLDEDDLEEPPPRPPPPTARGGCRRARGDGPVGDEAAEMG